MRNFVTLDEWRRLQENPKEFLSKDLVTCTEREFAAVIGVSPSMGHKLKVMGVASTTAGYEGGKILLQDSLNYYRRAYLQPHKRLALDARLTANGYSVFLQESE